MKGKRERPLALDMDFGEALGRFIQADPAEARALERRRPPKEPPPPLVSDGDAVEPAQSADTT